MLVTLVVLFVFFAYITARRVTLSKRVVNRLMRVCIALEVIAICAIGGLNLLDYELFAVRFPLSVACTIVSSLAIYYWLRRARGTNTATAAVFVFSALILSEIELYFCSSIPDFAGNFVAGALAILQYPCMKWARTATPPYAIDAPTQATDYFGFSQNMIKSKQFLIATAVGIGLLSVVIGLLRGYPDGNAISFQPTTRAAYGTLTIVLSVAIIALVTGGRKRIMTVGIFTVMETLACLALIAYAAFPEALDIGAVFTTTLNALMVAFTWYIIIAFMSYGWRDPYYYAIAGWLVWLGARAVSRMALMFFYGLSGNDSLMSIVMASLVVVSTQVVSLQFLSIASGDSTEKSAERDTARNEHARTEEKPKTIVRIMGLDGGESLAGMRQTSMRHSAEIMGEQFLLSEREVDVLALYALGFTQKKVAEELYITPSTTHAHIKRIYAKTGLHSRQEILDYIEQYAS